MILIYHSKDRQSTIQPHGLDETIVRWQIIDSAAFFLGASSVDFCALSSEEINIKCRLLWQIRSVYQKALNPQIRRQHGLAVS